MNSAPWSESLFHELFVGVRRAPAGKAGPAVVALTPEEAAAQGEEAAGTHEYDADME